MIPTHYKVMLPKNLSYPLGAQAISEALASDPHAALAEVLDQPRDMALVVAVAEPLPITPVTRPLVQTSTRYPCHTKSGSNRSRPGPGAAREQSAPGPPGGGGEPGAPQLAN